MKYIIDEAMGRSEAENRIKPSSMIQSDEELVAVLEELTTVIRVIGCGGGGSNTIDRLAECGIQGADLYALNTDAQHLLHINADRRFLIGRRTTRGLGAGSLPAIGEEAAQEDIDEIRAAVEGADMIFVTCGLGGGHRHRSLAGCGGGCKGGRGADDLHRHHSLQRGGGHKNAERRSWLEEAERGLRYGHSCA